MLWFVHLRAVCRLARTALHLLAGATTVALVYPWLGDSRRLALKQRWSRQLLGALGVRLVRDTTRPQLQGLLVANHISFVDIFVINALAPAAFVAKDEVLAWPLIGWLCRHTDTLFIARGSRRAAQETREAMVAALGRQRLLVVFPEGTTSDGHDVLPFHGALFQSAIDAGTAVTPLVLRYTDRAGRPSGAADYVGDTSLAECLWAIACASGLTAHVEILPTLASTDGDRRHLAAHTHRVISHRLKRLLNPSPTAAPAADTAAETPAGLADAPR